MSDHLTVEMALAHALSATTPDEAAAIEAHAAACPECAALVGRVASDSARLGEDLRAFAARARPTTASDWSTVAPRLGSPTVVARGLPRAARWAVGGVSGITLVLLVTAGIAAAAGLAALPPVRATVRRAVERLVVPEPSATATVIPGAEATPPAPRSARTAASGGVSDDRGAAAATGGTPSDGPDDDRADDGTPRPDEKDDAGAVATAPAATEAWQSRPHLPPDEATAELAWRNRRPRPTPGLRPGEPRRPAPSATSRRERTRRVAPPSRTPRATLGLPARPGTPPPPGRRPARPSEPPRQVTRRATEVPGPRPTAGATRIPTDRGPGGARPTATPSEGRGRPFPPPSEPPRRRRTPEWPPRRPTTAATALPPTALPPTALPSGSPSQTPAPTPTERRRPGRRGSGALPQPTP